MNETEKKTGKESESMKTTQRIRDYAGGRIHLIGIGGSSMSGLAEMLIDQGYRVTGSDRDETYLVHHVREKGGTVMIGHRAENVHGADFVVYSAAISPENPEKRGQIREISAISHNKKLLLAETIFSSLS